MWIMTPNAFTSTVDKEGGLSVRTRDYGSAVHLCKLAGIDKKEIVHALDEAVDGAIRDYPYRVRVTPEQLKRYACAEIDAIDYSNFKNRAKEVKGAVYANALSRVWSAMYTLTPYQTRRKIRDAEDRYTARHPKPKTTTGAKGSAKRPWADADWWYRNFPKKDSDVLTREDEEALLPLDSMDADSDFTDILAEVDDVLERSGKKSVHDLTEDEWRQLMEENPSGI